MVESSGYNPAPNGSSLEGHASGDGTMRVRPVQVLLTLVGLILLCTYLTDIFEEIKPTGKIKPLRIQSSQLRLPPTNVSMKELARINAAPGMELAPLKLRPKLCPNPLSPFNSDSPFPMNFWYVKTFKTGSTTLSSVFNNICAHYGIVWLKWDLVKTAVLLEDKGDRPTPLESHMAAAIAAARNVTDLPFVAITSHLPYSQQVAERIPKPMLRFTSVRHPVSRTHSHFIQNLCYKAAQSWGWKPYSATDANGPPGPSACDNDPKYWAIAMQNDTLENRWAFAGSNYQEEMMFYYIKGRMRTVAHAVAQYDFIFVAERMNEALVIFMLEYGLTFEDIAYLPSKVRTGKYKSHSEMPKELNELIIKRNPKDIEIWEIANKRMDELRAQLQESCGMDIVAASLNVFGQLTAQVTKECADYIGWYEQHGFPGPYSWSGTPGIGDESGLGFRCVRAVARRFMAQLAGSLPSRLTAAAAGRADQPPQQQQQQQEGQYTDKPASDEIAQEKQQVGQQKRSRDEPGNRDERGNRQQQDEEDYVAGDGDVYDFESEADYGLQLDSSIDYDDSESQEAPTT